MSVRRNKAAPIVNLSALRTLSKKVVRAEYCRLMPPTRASKKGNRAASSPAMNAPFTAGPSCYCTVAFSMNPASSLFIFFKLSIGK
jgi:hypothetical protein